MHQESAEKTGEKTHEGTKDKQKKEEKRVCTYTRWTSYRVHVPSPGGRDLILGHCQTLSPDRDGDGDRRCSHPAVVGDAKPLPSLSQTSRKVGQLSRC